MANNKKEIINCRYKDQLRLEPIYSPVDHTTVLHLLFISLDNNTWVSLSRSQVDNLIQKLIDIRRQWPQQKESK